MEGIKTQNRYAAIAAILYLFLGAALNAQVPTGQSMTGSSKIAITSPSFNFGTVSEGTVVEHEFKFKNVGQGNLIIQRVVPSCGCTAVASSTEPVIPGGESSIKASLDTSGMDGERSKSIQIYTNDPDNTTFNLSLQGVVQREVRIEPAQLTFGDVSRGEEKILQFTVTSREGSGATVKSAQSFSKNVTVREDSSAGSSKKYSVILSKDLPLGQFRERVIINTVSKSGKERPINLPIFADVSGALRVNPSNVSFGVIEGKTALSRSVKLDNSGKIPVEILGVESKSDAVSAEVKEIAKGKAYVLKLTLDPLKVSADLRTSVVIRTNLEDSKELTLNVYGVKSNDLKG